MPRNHEPLQPSTQLGRLAILDQPPRQIGKGNYQYFCECECGKVGWFYSHKLRSGHTTSCGCFRSEQTGLRNIARSKF